LQEDGEHREGDDSVHADCLQLMRT